MIDRYTLPVMGKIWEDEFKFSTWLKIEILACEAREEMGYISKEDLQAIKDRAKFEVKRILEIEETTKHDVIAFLTNVAEHVGSPSRHIHYGMTSSDILDTTLSYQMKTSGELLLEQLIELSQTRSIGFAINYAKKYMDGSATLKNVVDKVIEDIMTNGLDVIDNRISPNFASFRAYELAFALNRLRGFRVKQEKDI